MNAMSRNRAIFAVVIALLLIIGMIIGFAYTQITPTEPPSIVSLLDVEQTPQYGSIDLKQSDEPATVAVTSAGGTVDISTFPKYDDLSAGTCSGFVRATPVLRLNTPSAGSNLNIYFVGSSGAALFVLTPSHDLYGCDQNATKSDGTYLRVSFVDFSPGAYTIWVASPTQGGSVSGSLSVKTGNDWHP